MPEEGGNHPTRSSTPPQVFIRGVGKIRSMPGTDKLPNLVMVPILYEEPVDEPVKIHEFSWSVLMPVSVLIIAAFFLEIEDLLLGFANLDEHIRQQPHYPKQDPQ